MKTEITELRLGGHSLCLEVAPEDLFTPNAVTRLFAKVVQIREGDTVFDIGSGVGPLAIWAAYHPVGEVHAVEKVYTQYDLMKRNVGQEGLSDVVHCYQGNLCDPIPPEIKADVLIADVSGIARGPARALGWYPPNIPTGGEDGTDVIIPLLDQARERIAPSGAVYFPVAVDLSASQKTMQVARESFGKLERVANPNFVLTQEQVNSLEEFRDLPYVNLQKKGSRTTWRGEIYRATEPIHT